MPSVTCGEPSQVKHPASAGGGEQDAKVFQVTPGVTLVDLERCSFRDERRQLVRHADAHVTGLPLQGIPVDACECLAGAGHLKHLTLRPPCAHLRTDHHIDDVVLSNEPVQGPTADRFERAEAELLQRPGDCADLMYAHVHEEVNVTRRARWVHTGTDRMRVDHQPADENPRFRVGGIRDFEYEVPRVDVVRDDDQVFRVSHSALIWSRARTPALCTRVGAARAQSTATSALCAIPVETHVLLPELGV